MCILLSPHTIIAQFNASFPVYRVELLNQTEKGEPNFSTRSSQNTQKLLHFYMRFGNRHRHWSNEKINPSGLAFFWQTKKNETPWRFICSTLVTTKKRAFKIKRNFRCCCFFFFPFTEWSTVKYNLLLLLLWITCVFLVLENFKKKNLARKLYTETKSVHKMLHVGERE